MPFPAVLRVAPRLDDRASLAWSRLGSAGPTQRRAAVLALLLRPGSEEEARAWHDETRPLAGADGLLGDVAGLPAAARLPVLDRLLDAEATAPIEARQALLRATRRLMCADGCVSALDRLVWLVVRHRLAGPVRPHRGGVREDTTLGLLPLAMRQAIAQFTAYLARLVPVPDAHARVGVAGVAWHDLVLRQAWGTASAPPTCHVPDEDALGRALSVLQSLGWLHRPALVRLWTEAAMTRPGLATGPDEPLPVAAEALWLACRLLDTPVPPELACRFVDPPVVPIGHVHSVADA